MTATEHWQQDSPEPLIEVRDVSAYYGSKLALERVSLEVLRGELVCIRGENGSGKSTLIKAILGIVQSRTGSVVLRCPISRISYIEQKVMSLFTIPVTVEEYVSLGLTGKHNSSSFRSERLEIELRRFEISDLRSSVITTLSGGERQRAHLARAMISDPLLVFLDEPTEGLDRAGKGSFYDLLLRLCKDERRSIVCITHDDFSLAKDSPNDSSVLKVYEMKDGMLSSIEPTIGAKL